MPGERPPRRGSSPMEGAGGGPRPSLLLGDQQTGAQRIAQRAAAAVKPAVTDAATLGYYLSQYLQLATPQFLAAVLTEVLPRFDVVPTNVAPDGAASDGLVLDMGNEPGNAAGNVLADAQAVPNNRAAHIHIALIGETHRNRDDTTRAQKLSRRAAELPAGKPILLVEERGLSHSDERYQAAVDATHQYVNEGDIVNHEFSEVQRSVAVAAHIFLRLAHGNQQTRRRVLVFFGENHLADIRTSLEYFIRNSVEFPWVAARLRTYFVFTSTA